MEEAHPLEQLRPLEDMPQYCLAAVDLDCLELLAAKAFTSPVHLELPVAHPAVSADQECQDLALEAHCLVWAAQQATQQV